MLTRDNVEWKKCWLGQKEEAKKPGQILNMEKYVVLLNYEFLFLTTFIYVDCNDTVHAIYYYKKKMLASLLECPFQKNILEGSFYSNIWGISTWIKSI